MAQLQYPVVTYEEWAPPPTMHPTSMNRFSERKLCGRAEIGLLGAGSYECFGDTSILKGYYGRLDLDVSEGNYIQFMSEVLDLAPFEFGTPFVPFDQLPAVFRASFMASGTLFWARTAGISVTRQWHRLHTEMNLRPDATPVRRTLNLSEGVSLSTFEVAARLVNWEYLRDAASERTYDGGRDLLGLEEFGQELNAIFAADPIAAVEDRFASPAAIELAPVVQRNITRDFAAPKGATALSDQSFNQLREIIEFHQTLYLSATPFSLTHGMDQSAVQSLILPLHSGGTGTNEIVNDMDVYDVQHLIHA